MNTEKLPIEFKEKWIAALRGGEYKQGQKALIVRPGDECRYCCLGVAYKVAKGRDPIDTQSGYLYNDSELNPEIDLTDIPQLLIGTGGIWTGPGNKIRKTLTEMNDTGKSFSEIADYIEANL